MVMVDPLRENHSTIGGGNPVESHLRRKEPSSLGTTDATTLGSPGNFMIFTSTNGVKGEMLTKWKDVKESCDDCSIEGVDICLVHSRVF